MKRLKKHEYLVFLDTAKDLTLQSPTWKRVDYSTVFSLSVGEKEEEKDYIAFENAITEIMSNSPELPQEIETLEGNAMYDFIIKQIQELPTGEDCKTGFLICFGGEDKKAWQGLATLTSKTLDTVGGKATFTIKMGGDISKGTYVINDGAPTFTPE